MTHSPATDTGRIEMTLDSLPTLPVVALQMAEVIHGRNVTVQQVAAVLRQDPSMSAKLLRLVNSPYFGIPGGVSDVARAIPFVGFNTIYQLVLSISVLEVLDARGPMLRSLWLHSLTVATAARELATELRCPDEGSCFTAGLLHDMGKIALAQVAPDKLTEAQDMVEREAITLQEAERRLGLSPHDRLGSRLARQWRFPAMLATPIEQHHAIHRVDVRERLASNLRTVTEIVTCADYLAHAALAPFGTQPSRADSDPATSEMLERNGFSDARLQQLVDRTRSQLERTKVFLSLLELPVSARPAQSP